MKPPFTEVVSRYMKLVYYFARRWTTKKVDIDDIVHDTFLRALKNYDRSSFETENDLKSWLLTICRNVTLNNSRSRPLESFNENIIVIKNEEKIVDEWLNKIIEEEDLKKIKNAIKKMGFLDQEVLRLRIYEELSFKQISDVLNGSEPAVKMRYYRIVKKIQEEIV